MQNINYKKKYLKYKKKYLELCNNINQSGGSFRDFAFEEKQLEIEEQSLAKRKATRLAAARRAAARRAEPARQAASDQALAIADTYETTLDKIPNMSNEIQNILESSIRSLDNLLSDRKKGAYRLLDDTFYHRKIKDTINCNFNIITLINNQSYNENDKRILLNETNLKIYLALKLNYDWEDLFATYKD